MSPPPDVAIRRLALLSVLLLASCDGADAPDPWANVLPPRTPQTFVSTPLPPIGPVPSAAQLRAQRMETNAFVHFGPNTATGDEWGAGQVSPHVFAPMAFDPGQWAALFREVGFGGAVLVAKHHDGFLLWPSAHSDYSVASSAWRGGRGDVIGEAAAALRAEGLAVGVYLSPWDRNHPAYGTAAYNDYFAATLAELIGPGGYGPVFEVWLDGAYGPEVSRADLDAYDWPRWLGQIREQAPEAIIALDQDVFWPGNEDGTAPETNWSVRDDFNRWAPYECDTTIRERTEWFWRPDGQTRSMGDLVEVYFRSVGRACLLLLNVPPDVSGRIPEADAERLRAWRRALDRIFAVDLARHADATASGVRDAAPGWAPGAALDGDPDTFWAAPPSADHTGWMELDLGAEVRANVLELAEPIRFGQRIGAFRLDAEVDGAWRTVARGTTVNYKRLVRFPATTARRWRVGVEGGRAAPALHTVGLYAAPTWELRWTAQRRLD